MNQNSNKGGCNPQLEKSDLVEKSDLGGQHNNMAPPNLHSHSQIDWLRLFFTGKFLNSSFLDLLSDAKKKADSVGEDITLNITDHSRVVVQHHRHSGKGANYLNVLMIYRGITIGVFTGPQRKNGKTLEMTVTGSLLTEIGLGSCRQIMKQALDDLRFEVKEELVGEIHFAVDIPVEAGEIVQLMLDGHLVTRVKDRQYRQTYGKWSGATLGQRHKKYLRIYDKKEELKKEPRKADIYEENISGGPLSGPLTRVEFEIGREEFTEHSINTYEDLCNSVDDLLEYLVKDWFRIQEKALEADTKKRTNSARGRDSLHPIWQAVSDGFKALSQKISKSGKSVFQKSRKPNLGRKSFSRTITNVVGHLSGWFASSGVEPSDGFLEELVKNIEPEIKRKTWEKHMKTEGQTFSERFYVPEKDEFELNQMELIA